MRESSRKRKKSAKVKEEENRIAQESKKIKREKVVLEVEQEDKPFACKTPFEIKLEHGKPKMLEDEDEKLKTEPGALAGMPV